MAQREIKVLRPPCSPLLDFGSSHRAKKRQATASQTSTQAIHEPVEGFGVRVSGFGSRVSGFGSTNQAERRARLEGVVQLDNERVVDNLKHTPFLCRVLRRTQCVLQPMAPCDSECHPEPYNLNLQPWT